jgi:protein-disulfide isomerase
VTARVRSATAVRVGLAAVWVWAAASTIGDPAATVRAVEAYRLISGTPAEGVGYGLPFLELALALLLLLGLATRIAAVVSAAVAALILAGLVSAAARDLTIGCGCFGGGGPASGGAVALLAVLLALSVLLAIWPRTFLALDDRVRRSAAAGVPEVRVGPRKTAEARRRAAELAAQREAAAQRRLLVAGALAGVLLVLVTGVGIGVQAARRSAEAGPRPLAVSDSGGITVGRDSARVTIEIYEDPQCATCATLEREAGAQLDQWQRTGTAKVNYYVVSFLDKQTTTNYSSRAAGAVYCANDAAVFPRYHQLLFANQPAEGSAGLSDDELLALGAQAGMDEDTLTTFRRCLAGRSYADFVTRITERANQDGILATPTVLLDGKPIQPTTLAALTTAVNAAT